ncbi:uncharacterized protein LOC131221934 [Magnolia sinica]|uniref:uncharacterized protein LOC131221934 n=1 Tax=Magnolia sinica TaxID=86752 RepID=UPI002659AFB6|nr:uncharacterized protein LOC131221934 [Magnolia sinica]
MKMSRGSSSAILLLLFFVSAAAAAPAASLPRQSFTCTRKSRCFLKKIRCPPECPLAKPLEPKAKGCFVDCNSPKCEAICRNRKPNCNSPGAACFDPRFIGGDGIVFYFHGRSDEHFSLISDTNLQINARFIGLRPTGRSRDYTWIQALGIMFGSHKFALEAKRTARWNDEVDHLQFSYNEKLLIIPESHLSEWKSSDDILTVERTASRNSVTVTLAEIVEISINVVPVTEEDDRVHNYQIPSNDCFAHLEVQFRFFGLSSKVDGVIGRTYRLDYENPAKPGVAMPMVGGEDEHRTSVLLSSDCRSCIFSPADGAAGENSTAMDFGTLDCTSTLGNGSGIVCRK